MAAICAISLFLGEVCQAAVRREATPETLSSVSESVKKTPRTEDVEIVLKPGIYELSKLLPKAAGDVHLGFRLGPGKKLCVTGADDPAKVVLVGGAADVRTIASSGPVLVEGITFRGFRTSGSGAALKLKPGDRVNNCRFENCVAEGNGGAVAVGSVFTGVVAISNCVFVANRAVNGAGGGLFVQADPRGKTRVINCTFKDNIAACRAPAAKHASSTRRGVTVPP